MAVSDELKLQTRSDKYPRKHIWDAVCALIVKPSNQGVIFHQRSG